MIFFLKRKEMTWNPPTESQLRRRKGPSTVGASHPCWTQLFPTRLLSLSLLCFYHRAPVHPVFGALPPSSYRSGLVPRFTLTSHQLAYRHLVWPAGSVNQWKLRQQNNSSKHHYLVPYSQLKLSSLLDCELICWQTTSLSQIGLLFFCWLTTTAELVWEVSPVLSSAQGSARVLWVWIYFVTISCDWTWRYNTASLWSP